MAPNCPFSHTLESRSGWDTIRMTSAICCLTVAWDVMFSYVVPWQQPYDFINRGEIKGGDRDTEILEKALAWKQHDWKLFDITMARNAGYVVNMSNNPNVIVHYEGKFYYWGLLWHLYYQTSLKAITIPHPDFITFLVEANIDPNFSQRSHMLFSAQFWKQGDIVWPWVGPFEGQRAVVVAGVGVEQQSKCSI